MGSRRTCKGVCPQPRVVRYDNTGTKEGRVVKGIVRLVCLIFRHFGGARVVIGGFLEGRMIFDSSEFII